ncbi:hypothetical protein BO71DRAFT_408609 [Aspergillus ellipticus CBS 707.79]|uniref:Uncharacterized protein n=1 Tax=Aspergillus ellipticus CBS 707.79 TaxID=1448320 RepID=A0A319DDD0_9EURO|nr:hypothetical protein BO71DRAFT_408609 [Aspergillus ellipticus CBS 707.79]
MHSIMIKILLPLDHSHQGIGGHWAGMCSVTKVPKIGPRGRGGVWKLEAHETAALELNVLLDDDNGQLASRESQIIPPWVDTIPMTNGVTPCSTPMEDRHSGAPYPVGPVVIEGIHSTGYGVTGYSLAFSTSLRFAWHSTRASSGQDRLDRIAVGRQDPMGLQAPATNHLPSNPSLTLPEILPPSRIMIRSEPLSRSHKAGCPAVISSQPVWRLHREGECWPIPSIGPPYTADICSARGKIGWPPGTPHDPQILASLDCTEGGLRMAPGPRDDRVHSIRRLVIGLPASSCLLLVRGGGGPECYYGVHTTYRLQHRALQGDAIGHHGAMPAMYMYRPVYTSAQT